MATPAPLPVDPWQLSALTALAVGAARTVPLALLVPALGGPRASRHTRVGLGLLLAVLVLPTVLPAVAAPGVAALSPLGWALLVAREIVVGVTVGLAAGALFRAAEAAGQLADVLRGAGSLAPDQGQGEDGGRDSALGSLYLFVAVIVFLELGGLGLFASALARSYQAIPVDALPPSPGSLGRAATLVVVVIAKLVESALGLAAPVVVAMVLADVALGIVARAAPHVPLHFVALPARALLGLGAVLVGLGALAGAITAAIPAWSALIARIITVFQRP